MDFLADWLTNWLKELFDQRHHGGTSKGSFDTVKCQKSGEIAVQVGDYPRRAWETPGGFFFSPHPAQLFPENG